MVNIAICDDDLEFQEFISAKIQACMDKLFGMDYRIMRMRNLTELEKHLQSSKTDILFLDILVNDVNAMDWSIENLPRGNPQVIFMTGFPQSAYSISESNCCYYLMKSRITEERLSRAIQCALQHLTKKDPNLAVVKSGSKNHILNYANILYLETFNNNSILIHRMDGEDLVLYSTLKKYAQILPPNFLMCHQSYLVNMNHIVSFEPHKFSLRMQITLPIPPKKYKTIIAAYKKYLDNI